MNLVTIDIDDETKRLVADEMLTTGSKYQVKLSGRVFAEGSRQTLFVFGARGRLLSYAELEGGEGVLTTNTDEFQAEAARMPIDAVMTFKMALHASGDDEGENVGVGTLAVRSAGGTWTDTTTGAPTLYKGEQGEQGVGVLKMEDVGETYDGARIVKITYTDQRVDTITVPRGKPGRDALVSYIKESLADKYHSLELVREGEEWAIRVNKTGVTPEMTEEDATIEANLAADRAKKYAYGTAGEPPSDEQDWGALQYRNNTIEQGEAAVGAIEEARGAAIAAVSGDGAASAKSVAIAAVSGDGATSAKSVAIAAVSGDGVASAKTQAVAYVNAAADAAVASAQTNIGATEYNAERELQTAANQIKATTISAINSKKDEAIAGVDDAKDAAIAAIGEFDAVTRDEDGNVYANLAFQNRTGFMDGVYGPGLIEKSVTFNISGAQATLQSITGLEPETSYLMLVLGKGEYTGTVSVTMDAGPVSDDLVAIPTIRVVAASKTQRDMGWFMAESSDEGVIYLKIKGSLGDTSYITTLTFLLLRNPLTS